MTKELTFNFPVNRGDETATISGTIEWNGENKLTDDEILDYANDQVVNQYHTILENFLAHKPKTTWRSGRYTISCTLEGDNFIKPEKTKKKK